MKKKLTKYSRKAIMGLEPIVSSEVKKDVGTLSNPLSVVQRHRRRVSRRPSPHPEPPLAGESEANLKRVLAFLHPLNTSSDDMLSA